MPERTIDEAWRSYRSEVMPPNPSPNQLTETRRAFYAGAQAFHGLLLDRVIDSRTNAHLVAVGELVDSLDAELQAFNGKVAEGQA